MSRTIPRRGAPNGLLWVTGEPASWSADFAELLRQARLADSEVRSLQAAPGHVFAPGEEGVAAGMVLMLLVMRWTFCLVCGQSGFAAQVEGDRLTVAARGRSLLPLARQISKLGDEIELLGLAADDAP